MVRVSRCTVRAGLARLSKCPCMCKLTFKNGLCSTVTNLYLHAYIIMIVCVRTYSHTAMTLQFHIQLKGLVGNSSSSQEYKFSCKLTTFEKDANDFTRSLSKFVDNPQRFVQELSRAINGEEIKRPRKRQASKHECM